MPPRKQQSPGSTWVVRKRQRWLQRQGQGGRMERLSFLLVERGRKWGELSLLLWKGQGRQERSPLQRSSGSRAAAPGLRSTPCRAALQRSSVPLAAAAAGAAGAAHGPGLLLGLPSPAGDSEPSERLWRSGASPVAKPWAAEEAELASGKGAGLASAKRVVIASVEVGGGACFC